MPNAGSRGLESKPPLLVFDSSISRNSPAGSCVLKFLQPIAGKWPLHLFISRTDIPDGELIQKTTIPLPNRPVLARVILYTLLTACRYLFRKRVNPSFRITTEGVFPLCDLSYAQCCHWSYLFRYRHFIGGNALRRAARILTHCWGAVNERIAFHSARTIVVPSRGLGREIASVYPESIRRKIHVIPNPVDVDAFRRPADFSALPIHERVGIPPHAFVLAFCALGNFEWKGLSLILQALKDLGDSTVHLIGVGGSQSEVKEFQNRAGRLGVSGRVHLLGWQPEIQPYFWSSNAFVFPSAYEGFPLVCLQAAAAGLPLIATSVNGVEEFLVNGVNGWIVERTGDSIRAAIQDAASSPERAAEMGRNSQRDVQIYREERFQARWLELLEQECAPS